MLYDNAFMVSWREGYGSTVLLYVAFGSNHGKWIHHDVNTWTVEGK